MMTITSGVTLKARLLVTPAMFALSIGGCGGDSTGDTATDGRTATDAPVVLGGGELNTPREKPRAVVTGPGEVLVVGGSTNNGTPTDSVELFRDGGWTRMTSLGVDGREDHTLTVLEDGSVLAVGGSYYPASPYSDAEVFKAGGWTETGSMSTVRTKHTATLLNDGRVLIAGGCTTSFCSAANSLDTAEVYDPASGMFVATANNLSAARFAHSATLLGDGRVLLVAGGNGLASTDIYDPATNSFAPGPALEQGRSDHTATVLPDGAVLISGGSRMNGGALKGVELFDGATWRIVGGLPDARYLHTATLAGSFVVFVGGQTDLEGSVATVDVYNIDSGVVSRRDDLELKTARYNHAAVPLGDAKGSVMVIGGRGQGDLSSVELIAP